MLKIKDQIEAFEQVVAEVIDLKAGGILASQDKRGCIRQAEPLQADGGGHHGFGLVLVPAGIAKHPGANDLQAAGKIVSGGPGAVDDQRLGPHRCQRETRR